MKIKNYVLVVLVIGLISLPVAAQRRRAEQARGSRVSKTAQELSAAERTTALDTSLSTTCSEAEPAAPRALAHDPQVFSPNRIASTLNGVWLGRVSGDYDKQLLAKDGFLNVDYYMVVDISRGEAFVYQEFTSRRSGEGFTAKPNAPTWSYVWCAKENYQTKSPRQIHTFTKVSDNVNDSQVLLTNSTGVKFSADQKVVLSDVWRTLVDAKFFDDPQRSLAYAGVLFNPITMGTVTSPGGGSLFELRMVGEYRGSGETAAKFNPGEPIYNVEQAHFLGLPGGSGMAAGSSTGSSDFLVASVGLTNQMEGPKADAQAAVFSTQMAFDKVVIGPLSSGASAAQAVKPPAKAKSSRTGRGGQ